MFVVIRYVSIHLEISATVVRSTPKEFPIPILTTSFRGNVRSWSADRWLGPVAGSNRALLRRARIPPLGWWLCVILGAVMLFYGASHSTVPSLSARTTAVGKVYDCVKRDIHTGLHHNTIYGFRFVPEGGEPVNIETEISLPCPAVPAFFNGQIFRVVYLADTERFLKNEAVAPGRASSRANAMSL